MNNLTPQPNMVEERPDLKQSEEDEVLTLAGFIDLLAKFDFEDKKKEKPPEKIIGVEDG